MINVANPTVNLETKINIDQLTTMKQIINTPNAPAPIGPYNQAILIGNTLYTSGQIALHPKTMELVMDSIEAETKQVMENMKAVLAAADMTFNNVVKTSIFISDIYNFAKVNTVMLNILMKPLRLPEKQLKWLIYLSL